MSALNEWVCHSKECTNCNYLKKNSLFTNLGEEEIRRFADSSLIQDYIKGQDLYVSGEEAQYFYIICSGWVKLFQITENGEEINLAMLTKEAATGDNAIFEHGRFASNAQIVEDAQILRIPLSLLKEQMAVNGKLAFNMLTSMIEYQRRHELQLEQFIHYSAPQRIGCFLLGLCPVADQKDGVELTLPYDKNLIASTLGMKGATFSRALNMLRDETGIKIHGNNVKIDSMARLLKFVDGCYSHTHLYPN